jgi:uncharacterized membrane protein YdjX (TVP38/TMEM64 family)
MLKPNRFIALIIITAILVTIVGVLGLGKLDEHQVEAWLAAAGIWAPLLYILLYTLGTLLLLPSTPLNLAGGAIFGIFQGTIWTTISAVVAALVAFVFTRTVGRNFVLKRLPERWLIFDKKIEEGGFSYIFSVRLIPVIPYGIVNFLSGLTSIRIRDYFWATLLGTIIGIFPFVMLGSGFRAMSKGQFLPLLLGASILGIFIFISTVYKQLMRPG